MVEAATNTEDDELVVLLVTAWRFLHQSQTPLYFTRVDLPLANDQRMKRESKADDEMQRFELQLEMKFVLDTATQAGSANGI